MLVAARGLHSFSASRTWLGQAFHAFITMADANEASTSQPK